MNWLKIKNNTKVPLCEIPTLHINQLREDIKCMNMRPVAFFGQNILDGVKLFVILASIS